jgi:transcriptional regulator with XRE-family HTH domain
MQTMKIDQDKAKKQLGSVIRKKRQELDYSQEAFADQCGVHRTYMGAIERGERNISLMNIIKVSNALNMKPSKLLELAKL